MSKKTFGSASDKAKSEKLRRECVEFLAHYSLSKEHTGCTVSYDKDTVTISICETTETTAASTDSTGYTNVSFSGTGLNDWYRALNRAGYRTFMGGHELVLTVKSGGSGTEEIWHYLNPPLKHGSNGSQESSSESQSSSTGVITFMGHNTTCDFDIVVNYNASNN